MAADYSRITRLQQTKARRGASSAFFSYNATRIAYDPATLRVRCQGTNGRMPRQQGLTKENPRYTQSVPRVHAIDDGLRSHSHANGQSLLAPNILSR